MNGGAPSAAPRVLDVEHRTRYAYSSPVSASHHVAHLQPLSDAHQQLRAWTLQIEPGPAHSRASRDGFGNAQHHFELHATHTRLEVCARSRVAMWPRHAGLKPEDSPAWDSLAARLRYVAGGAFEPALEFALPSPYVPRLPALAGFAAPSFLPGRPVAAVALDLMHRIHAEFAYEARSTDVDTPLARVLAQRRGVCQDFAHIMITVCRSWGIPARYVSGYLFTDREGGDRSDPDASHAWLEVFLPSIRWIGFDPTNNILAGERHVSAAIGRDYADIPPSRGVYKGEAESQLAVGVNVRRARPTAGEPEFMRLASPSFARGGGRRRPGSGAFLLERQQQQQQ